METIEILLAAQIVLEDPRWAGRRLWQAGAVLLALSLTAWTARRLKQSKGTENEQQGSSPEEAPREPKEEAEQ